MNTNIEIKARQVIRKRAYWFGLFEGILIGVIIMGVAMMIDARTHKQEDDATVLYWSIDKQELVSAPLWSMTQQDQRVDSACEKLADRQGEQWLECALQ